MRVLIADDNKGVRKTLRWILKQWPNLEVCAETANGREAVDAAKALRPDLLILDVRMPELNGIEVALILKDSLPEAKTILFTMYDDYVGRQIAATAGVQFILAKAEGFPGFKNAIESILNS
jgi:DNA-binding NarL/FixJ family response regulator